MRSVVVLPAPSGPMSPNISPAAHLEGDVLDGRGPAPKRRREAASPARARPPPRRVVVTAGRRAGWSRAAAGMPGLKRPSAFSRATLTL